MKPPEPMEKDFGEGQNSHRVVAPVKKKKYIRHKTCRICRLNKVVAIQIFLSWIITSDTK
jgi:hypothetical protein